ncbi:MAG: hypothetical protein RBT49_14330 [Bacteroidales bacterium]|nr:hypothetical protein [Bacteroidales bacterium]
MIKDSLGNPIADGKYLITFRLYNSENSNDPVWFENQNVYIYDGILNVLLGNKQRLRPELFRDPLWVTLEIDKEESEKQYVSASSYSMYSGLVDLAAFAPSDDVQLSLDPDGRIVIDLINPYPTPIPDPNPTLNTIKFGLKVLDTINTTVDSYQYLTMNNKNGLAVGAFSHNLTSNTYKTGDDFEDFVISAKDGRDLVLMSESGTYGTNREVSVGTPISPNNLKVTGDLSVTGKLTTSLFNSNDFFTGGDNSWLFHTPDDGRQYLCVTNKNYASGTWPTQTVFYENGDFSVKGNVFVSKDINVKNIRFDNIDITNGYEFFKMNNSAGELVGGLMYNVSNLAYQGGLTGNDLVLYAANERDLVLKSNKINGDVYVGAKNCANNLRVYGKILATEIEVKLDVDFPDYVFNKNYNLLPLAEVERHINSFGHLPGMPSGKEVEENGLNISEMQLKLVEKIEELTLHMIRLEKENNELKDRLNSITE